MLVRLKIGNQLSSSQVNENVSPAVLTGYCDNLETITYT